MKPVYLAGRALATVLGLNLDQAMSSLRRNSAPVELYRRIPDQISGWNKRARALITQVAGDAGAELARDGALFIATSCLDGDGAEQGNCDMDFHALSRRVGSWLDWRCASSSLSRSGTCSDRFGPLKNGTCYGWRFCLLYTQVISSNGFL